MQQELLTGVFQRERWRPNIDEQPDNDFVIAALESGEVVLGDASRGDLIPGLTYRFFGHWEEKVYRGRKERQFRFRQYVKAEPHSRFGLVKYLERYARDIGPTIAGRLFDQFGSDAVKVLRENPKLAADSIENLKLEVAQEAGRQLREMGEIEDIKIELMNLFAGRGFSHQMPRLAVKKWGILAPKRISRDPFCLLVAGLPGCGFARCDRLYQDLGLPLHRIKRLMLCVWHGLRTDTAGHTWHEAKKVVERLRQQATVIDEGVESSGRKRKQNQVMRALELGIRSGWLAMDRRDGGLWLAEGEKARDELRLAVRVLSLCSEPDSLPRFTEAVDGECDLTDSFRLSDPVDVLADEDDIAERDLETMARQGRETGICQFCGRKLVSELSVELGYGPVCADRWGLPYGDNSGVPNEGLVRALSAISIQSSQG